MNRMSNRPLVRRAWAAGLLGLTAAALVLSLSGSNTGLDPLGSEGIERHRVVDRALASPPFSMSQHDIEY